MARARFTQPSKPAGSAGESELGATGEAVEISTASRAKEGAENGSDFIVGFHSGTASNEAAIPPDAGLPVSLALAPVGIPWLLTERAILRRSIRGSQVHWTQIYQRPADQASLVGIGFTPAGARALDALGGSVMLQPHDITAWRRFVAGEAG